MGSYVEELTKAMTLCANVERALFLGQAIKFPGTAMTQTFKDVVPAKLIEMPVAEDMQMGICIGLALDGALPISVYPRWNFLLLAASQLVLHLDKMADYSRGEFKPKVLIRVGVGHNEPMDPGPQHLGDFTYAFRHMTRNIKFAELKEPRDVVPAYQKALDRPESTILVEHMRAYNG